MGAGVAVTLFGAERLFGGDLRALIDVAVRAKTAGMRQGLLPNHVNPGPRNASRKRRRSACVGGRSGNVRARTLARTSVT